jgi:hypothetical protein
VGICAIPTGIILSLAQDDKLQASNLEELYARLTSQHIVQCMHVENDQWQRVITAVLRRSPFDEGRVHLVGDRIEHSLDTGSHSYWTFAKAGNSGATGHRSLSQPNIGEWMDSRW